MRILDLTSLTAGMPAITPSLGTSLAEAAAVSLESCDHNSGHTVLQVLGSLQSEFKLYWHAVDEQQRRAYRDSNIATEYGAIGIAILVLNQLTGMVVVDQTVRGAGFDYWLGTDNDQFMQGRTRLEISGIRHGTEAMIARRSKQKIDQINKTSHLDGYVVIVEFSTPIALVEEV